MALYGAETWTLRAADQKIKLRKIFKITTNYNYFSLNCVAFLSIVADKHLK